MDQVTLLGRVGGELQVNSVTFGLQASSRITTLKSGGFVVVWTDFGGSDGDLSGVKAQVYDAAGAKVGGEILVNGTTAGHQDLPSVAALADGGFVVNWRSGWTSSTNVGTGKMQLFDAAGAKVGGELSHSLTQNYSNESSALAGGGFVLLQRGGVGQVFDASGTKTAEFTVTAGPIGAAMVATPLADGRFVVAFEKAGGPAFQLFDAAGAKIGGEVSSGHAYSVGQLNVASLSTGGFVLSWSFSGNDQLDTHMGGVKAQIYDASGAKVGGLIGVNSFTAFSQATPSVIGLPGGGFIATWTSYLDQNYAESLIKGQVFNAAGAKVGTEFVVSVEHDGSRTNFRSDIALIGGDKLVAVWQGSTPSDPRGDQTTSGGGIRAQIYQPLNALEADVVPLKTTLSEIAMGNVAALSFAVTSSAVNTAFSLSLVSDSTGGAFAISGGKLVVADNRKLDFETAPTATVTVRVTDMFGNTTDEVVQLNIADSAIETRYAAGDEKSLPAAAQSSRDFPAMAAIDGGFVLVWKDSQASDIRGQRFDSSGSPVGAEFVVNTVTEFVQTDPAVTRLAGGGFAVSWSDYLTDHVKVQMFNAAGAKIGGEIVASALPKDFQYGDTSVTGLTTGGLVVAWEDTSGDSFGSAVRAQVFDAAGNKIGGEILVNTVTAGHQEFATVGALAGGGFVIAWQDNSGQGADTSSTAIKAQLFDGAGNTVGGEFLVNTSVLGDQGDPSVAVAADGSFLIVWTHFDPVSGLTNIRGQRFDAGGAKAGGEFVISPGYGHDPSVTAGPAGTYAVTWTGASALDSNGSGILGQLVSAAGALVGDTFLVNALTAANERGSLVAFLDDGTLATAWEGPSGIYADVKFRLFADPARPIARNDLFVTTEAAAVSGNLFVNNGGGADTGADLRVVAVNGAPAGVGQAIQLASGARATINADGSISIDPTGASWLPAASSGAIAQATDILTYTLAGGATALVTIRINGLASADDIYMGTTGPDRITASEGADVIRVNQVNVPPHNAFDNISALGGDDVIYVGSALMWETRIDGGAGNDTLVVRSGDLTLRPGNLIGIETVQIRSGTAAVHGEPGGAARNANVGFSVGQTYAAPLAVDASDLTQAEKLTFAGVYAGVALTVTGGAGGDSITGGWGADILSGGAGNDVLRGADVHNGDQVGDVLRGGLGDDLFYVSAGDVAEENENEGFDEVISSGSHTLGANVEKLTSAAHSATLVGNAIANTITGGAGADVIDGKGGADVMRGGLGDDVYTVDDAGDVIEELADQGTDTVATALAAYSLAARPHLENLTGTAASGQSLTGSAGNNAITGGAGNDVIDGGAGNDTIDGGAGDDVIDAGSGADTLIGGAGNDVLRDSDLSGVGLSRFYGGDGFDTLDFSAHAGGLAVNAPFGTIYSGNTEIYGVERIVGGSGSDSMTLANYSGGIELYGGAGNDLLQSGEFGVDKLYGEAGDDSLILHAGDSGFGGEGDDVLSFNGGPSTPGHIVVDGGAGSDRVMLTFPGFTLDLATGIGSVGSWTLAFSSVERIDAAISGGKAATVSGSDSAETFRVGFSDDGSAGVIFDGRGGDDELIGGKGNDLLTGGAGADRLAGGLGNDVYVVDAFDTVVENAGEGSDEIRTSLASFSLATYPAIENLTGTAASGQSLTGNAAANAITGGGGGDVIQGGAGGDTLRGGAGADRFVYAAFSDSLADARDRILDFEAGIDKIDLLALGRVRLSFAQASENGTAYTLLTVTSAGGTSVIRVDGTITSADILAETGIVGTQGDDVLEGSEEGEDLVGLGGNDRLYGLGGRDLLLGGEGNDLLDGGTGADWMEGGAGDDVFVVDDGGDLVLEQAGEGTDEVQTALAAYSLTAHVEVLTGTAGTGQTLTGNGLGNTIRGGTGDDILYGEAGDDSLFGGAGNDAFNGGAGNDTIDGGTGADIMGGLAGDDLFLVDDAGDRVIEAAGEGTDEVRTGLASYALEGNVENLTGTSATGQALTGNDLGNLIIGGMGDDVIYGLGGDDIIVGFAGADVLRGGGGNDVYAIDAADTVIELDGDGIDEIRTVGAIYVLGVGLENLRATSDVGHDFRGNLSANAIIGGDGNDIIRLQDGGDDVAYGKNGVDSFYFGGSFDGYDFVHGGGNRDSLLLQGNYDLTLAYLPTGRSSIVDVEGISLVSGSNASFGDTAGRQYSYKLKMVDDNVLAGGLMKVNGFTLQAGENFTLDASAETDAALQILGGLGTDTLTGGAQGDAFVFGHDGRFAAGDKVVGGGGYDVVYLRGDYTVDFNAAGFAGALTGVESIALLTSSNTEFLAGGDGDFDYSLTWADDMLAAGGTFTVNGSRLQSFETFVFDGSAETNGTLRVFGGNGGDTLKGGAGNDQISGGGGADQLTGGAGADLFRFLLASDSTTAAFDTVTDFVAGVDRIDVSRIDAKASTPENESFAFIGAAAFSASGPNAPGELRAFNVSGGLWQVEGDVNGDGTADFMVQVQVDAGQPLTVSDFVL